MIKKVLVTGSLGQLGSYLCEDLFKDDIEVIGLDNEINKCIEIKDEIDKITVKGDIRNRKIVDKIMCEVDSVVHCAAQVSVDKSINNPIYDADNNIIGTLNLLDSALKVGSINRFVFISTAAVYGNPVKLPIDETHPKNPLSGYGLSKLAAEKYVRMFYEIHKLPTVVIRPFNFYSKRSDPKSPYSGVITKFISRVKENKAPIIEGDGEQTRDFFYVQDVVNIIRASLIKEEAVGKAFNCGKGRQTSINELSEIIIKLFDKDLEPVYVEKRKGDIKHSYSDVSKAKNLLEYNSEYSLKEGLEKII